MTTLTLIPCFASAPSSCRNEEVILNGAEIQCIALAQQAMMKIPVTRPKWRVAGSIGLLCGRAISR